MHAPLMNRVLSAGLASVLVAAALGDTAEPSRETTVTGWFACDRCAPARLKLKKLTATNRECTQRCIAEGARMVFIDEKTRTIRDVANPDMARGQESHYVRVTGAIEEDGHMLRVRSIKVLEHYVASCSRPSP